MKNLPAKRQSPQLDAQLRLKYGAELSEVALVLPQTLDDDEIVEIGRQVRVFANASPWWLADYVLFCQRIFLESPKRRRKVYDRIANLWPPYERKTLRNIASIARRVPVEIRSPALSFAHHAHIATLADEPEARALQEHYIKTAEKTEATAEELRLMIADTRNGVRIGKPARAGKRAAIDIGAEPAPPVEYVEPEPELLAGGHAQIASEAQRACARLREWYAAQARKSKVADWTDERKRVLIDQLQPLINEMHQVVEIFSALTNAEQSGEWPGA
jgi:hypothetical protein